MIELDLTKPVIVVAGAWNPAIFSAQWCARNLFGFQKGDAVEVAEFFERDPAGGIGVPVTVYPPYKLGIAVSQGRMAIYMPDLSPQSIDATEQLMQKVCALLPHTPVSGVGINFALRVDNPIAGQADKLATHEGLDELYTVEFTSVSTRISFPDKVLNLYRAADENSLQLNFNFHHEISEICAIPESIVGHIGLRLHDVKELISKVYDLNEDIKTRSFADVVEAAQEEHREP